MTPQYNVHSAGEYKGYPVSSAFIMDSKPYAWIEGPVGSGKSTAGLMKIWRHAKEQAKSPKDGRRYTRWAVVRNTYKQLERTTLKSWFKFFQPGVAGTWLESKKVFIIDNKEMYCEVHWFGLDNPEDIANLLSLELTGIFFDEFVFMKRDFVEDGYQRTGRYPLGADGQCSWHGVFGASNSGTTDMWWYDYLFDEIRTNVIMQRMVSHYVQPPGDMPNYENRDALLPTYYQDMIDSYGNNVTRVDRFVRCKWTAPSNRAAVYPRFNRLIHVASAPIKLNPHLDLLMGYDPGIRNSAAVFGQYDHRNNSLVLVPPSFPMEGVSTEAFVKDMLLPTLEFDFEHWMQRFAVCCDPNVAKRSDADEKTAGMVLDDFGIHYTSDSNNTLTYRINAVDSLLGRILPNGKPALQIDPRLHDIINDFESGYAFKVNPDGTVSDLPVKNASSHRADAVQYLALSAPVVEGRPVNKHIHAETSNITIGSIYA